MNNRREQLEKQLKVDPAEFVSKLLKYSALLVLICEYYPIDNNNALALSHLGQRDILNELRATKTQKRYLNLSTS